MGGGPFLGNGEQRAYAYARSTFVCAVRWPVPSCPSVCLSPWDLNQQSGANKQCTPAQLSLHSGRDPCWRRQCCSPACRDVRASPSRLPASPKHSWHYRSRTFMSIHHVTIIRRPSYRVALRYKLFTELFWTFIQREPIEDRRRPRSIRGTTFRPKQFSTKVERQMQMFLRFSDSRLLPILAVNTTGSFH